MDNRYQTKKNVPQYEPSSLPEAYDFMYLLIADINEIESQLIDKGREKNFPSTTAYHSWRKKANVALAMKLKQLESAKAWINSHGGQAPTEESDNVKPENISLGNNHRLATETRPDADKIINNMCGAIIQMRSLKRRLYPFYKIANAAFDLVTELGIDTNDPTDPVNQLIYWLDKAGYNVKEINGYGDSNTGGAQTWDFDEEDWEE
jgi:hypothetical protein